MRSKVQTAVGADHPVGVEAVPVEHRRPAEETSALVDGIEEQRVLLADFSKRIEADSKKYAIGSALLVGSSLMVFSGPRFVRQAVEIGKPVAIVNDGRTRADDLATLKLEGDCGDVLEALLDHLHPDRHRA